MDIEILSKEENALLNRIEVEFKVVHEGKQTPKRSEVKDMVATLLKASKDVLVIDHMESSYGKGESIGYAKVYKTADDCQKVEPDHILKRNNLFKEKKADKKEE